MVRAEKTGRVLINGRYELVERLGGGAQGAVYRVRDRLFPDRPTALKILGTAAPGALLRFEFEQLARLAHPHLVRVFELGLVDMASGPDPPPVGTGFFTEELVDGGPSHRFCRALEPEARTEAAARIGVAVARALTLLHARGLLHRDVKPSNILVGQDGRGIKLIDLGLSRPIALADGLRAGTVRYMAPEALEGFPDERSDLYSLGATLFHLLTGAAPRPGMTIVVDPPQRVPPAFWAVVKGLMADRAADRLGSAREVVLALGRAMGPGILGSGREGDLLDAASEAEDEGTRAARVRSVELIGRDVELSTLVAWLERTVTTGGHESPVAVVSGPPGVGKSRLARAAVVRAQLEGAERGGVVPDLLAGDLRQLVAARLRGLGAESGQRADRGGLAAVRSWLRGGQAPGGAPEVRGKEVLLQEMAELIGTGERPAVLLVEDADKGLAPDLIERMVELRVGGRIGSRVALIAEAREPERARRLARRTEAELVEIGPLDREAEARLVAEVLGRDPGGRFVDDLHDRTGGLPLLTEAVLAALTAKRPIDRIERGGLRDLDLPGDPEQLVLAGLLADAAGAARGLVEAMAVLGRPATLEEIADVAGVEIAEARGSLERLHRRGWLLGVGGDRLVLPGFAMGSLRESLGRTREQKLNRAAFEMLEGRPAADPTALSRHAARAGLKRRARELARGAAEMLEKAGDLPGAIEQLELLLEVTPVERAVETGIDLARLHRLTGNYARALDLLAGIGGGTPPLADRAAFEQAASLRLSGRADEALALLKQLSRSADPTVSMEARALAARTLLDQGALDEADAVLGDVEPAVREDLMHSGLLGTAGLIAMGRGDLERADALFTAGLEAAENTGEARSRARFLALRGMVAHRRGEWRLAAQRYQQALDGADEVGDRHGAATYAVNLAAALTEIDEVGEALARYRDGLGRLRRVGREGELAHAGANYAELLLRVGDLEAADEASRRALEAAERSGLEAARALACCVRGDVLITRGQSEDALDLLASAEKLYEAMGAARDVAIVRWHRAEAMLALGDLQNASAQLEAAIGVGDAGTELERRRVLVELAMAGQGDLADALDALLAALPEPGAGRGTVHLRAFVAAARAARRAGMSRIAREAARDALDILARVRRATPTLHRPVTDALEGEMNELAGQADGPSAGGSAPISSPSGAAPGWERLVRINTRLNSELRIGSLLDLIMDTAIDITSAERGFLLVADKSGKLRIRCARNIDRARLDRDDRDYSKSVAVRAYESGEPIVSTDAQEDEQFRGAHSVVALDLRYILAVPLNVQGRPTGTIYVDSRGGGRFDEARLALLRALADQAAIALTNARLRSENRKRQRRIERLNRELEIRLRAREGELEQVRRDLERRTDHLVTRYSYEGIIGRSQSMADVFRTLDRITATDLPVVILGESGTGKELVARAIHVNGPRRDGPFVAENCAAIPETLLESVLFGHVRGAFTGAVRDSRGLFTEADGGTLFLDEVGDMPLPMQTKLLRVLQEGEVRPVGGTKATRVDVRILVASNADLAALTKSGAFREDLFYRLNVIPVRLPPLRRRKEDIPLLAEHFVSKHRPEDPPHITQSALEVLMDYTWPGNVRQLENEMMRATVLCGDVLDLEHLSDEVVGGASQMSEGPEQLDLETHVGSLKRKLIQLALKRARGNRTKAAELLGVSRYGLTKMLTRFGL